LAGDDDGTAAAHLSHAPTVRRLGAATLWGRGAALTARGQAVATALRTEGETFAGRARLTRALLGRGGAGDAPRPVGLDMASAAIPGDGQQAPRASNGPGASAGAHPRRLVTRAGDCLAATRRPGDVPSAPEAAPTRCGGGGA
jgi:hypothetical protein